MKSLRIGSVDVGWKDAPLFTVFCSVGCVISVSSLHEVPTNIGSVEGVDALHPITVAVALCFVQVTTSTCLLITDFVLMSSYISARTAILLFRLRNFDKKIIVL